MMGKPHMYKGNRISPSQLIMLIKLADRPMYGYELLKALREDYQGLWDPQTGRCIRHCVVCRSTGYCPWRTGRARTTTPSPRKG